MFARINVFARAFVAAAVVATQTNAALAQDRLVVFGQEVGTSGRFGQKLGDAPAWIRQSTASSPQFVGGGRYVLTTEFVTTPSTVTTLRRAFGTFTGHEVTLPAAAGVTVDPVRARLFLLDGQDVRVFDLDSRATRVLAVARSVPSPPGVFGDPPLPEARYASGTARLFVRRADPTGAAWETAVIDVDSGALVRTLPDVGASGFAADWAVTPDGQQVFVAIVSFSSPPAIRAIDVATGQVSTAPLGTSTGPLVYDDAFERVFVLGGAGTGNTRVFDRQLNLLGTLEGGYCISQVRTSPHTGRVYHLRAAGGGGSYYGAIDTRLEAFDGATGRLASDASVTAALGMGTDRPVCGDYRMLLVTAPGAPRQLTAAVSGRDVTLAWQNVGDATSFVVDIGLAPGRTDFSVGLGGSTTATFAGVPPGRFYVRVRGGNAFGGGRPSAEAVVTVP